MNRGISVALVAEYNLYIKDKNRLSFKNQRTLIKQLDARKRNTDLHSHIPFWNESRLTYRRLLFEKTNDAKNALHLNIGYHYFQHGSQPDSDYWYTDSVNNTGIKVITGFRTHSAVIGLSWVYTGFKNKGDASKIQSKQTIEANYIIGIHNSLVGIDIYQDAIEKSKIDNTYSFNRHGFTVAYQYERILGKILSVYAEAEVLMTPFIDYSPSENQDLFIPRGGERILPLFPKMRVGIKLFF